MNAQQMKRDALIMANARRIMRAPVKTCNWVLAMDLFGMGSGTAWQHCIALGLDPESNVTRYNDMCENIDAQEKKEPRHD